MKLDLTVTVSVIIALSAILSPIIVAVINNRYNLKLKKIEFASDKKINSFETYLSNLRIYLNYPKPEKYNMYRNAMSTAILYASQSTLKIIFEIDDCISDNKLGNINNEIILSLCKSFQSDLGI